MLMDRGRATQTALAVALLFVGYAVGRAADPVPADASIPPVVAEVIQGPDGDGRVFELRTYTATEGKHEALLARFRDHTLGLFEKHGMTNVGYWTPQDAPGSGNTLVYVLAHASREAATASWRAFGADPEWQTVYAASREDGPLIADLTRVYLDPTDFSPVR